LSKIQAEINTVKDKQSALVKTLQASAGKVGDSEIMKKLEAPEKLLQDLRQKFEMTKEA